VPAKPKPEGKGVQATLKRKVGPVPVWLIVVAVLAVGGYFLFFRDRGTGDTSMTPGVRSGPGVPAEAAAGESAGSDPSAALAEINSRLIELMGTVDLLGSIQAQELAMIAGGSYQSERSLADLSAQVEELALVQSGFSGTLEEIRSLETASSSPAQVASPNTGAVSRPPASSPHAEPIPLLSGGFQSTVGALEQVYALETAGPAAPHEQQVAAAEAARQELLGGVQSGEAFVNYPSVGQATGVTPSTPSFKWGGVTWYAGERQAFTNWLKAHGNTYTTWASSHPSASAILEGR
jgi:hypothetical protein